MSSSYVSLRIEREGSLAEVILTGPGRGNPMGPELFNELPNAMATLDADDEIRVVLIRGEGTVFSTGLNLMSAFSELGPLVAGNPGARTRRSLLELIRRWQDAMTALERCRKPVVAVIDGWCLGGAIDLVSACDVRVCSTEARFGVREVRMGIVADLGTLQRLPRIVGEGNARQLALTGDDFDAAHAQRIGLVTDVVSRETLLDHGRALARRIGAQPPLVVEGIKEIMNASAHLTVEQGLRLVSTWNSAFLPSEDLAEAFSAFAEKRDPEFKGN